MNQIKIIQIGEVLSAEDGFAIKLNKEFKDGLTAVEGFSHLDILWWANYFEDDKYRRNTIIDKPYKKGPDKIGVFATRSPVRPNPIAVMPVYVLRIDYDNGMIYTPHIDAEPGTPVIDIKPYHPSSNVISRVSVPDWCNHWPKNIEESASFKWEKEFNF